MTNITITESFDRKRIFKIEFSRKTINDFYKWKTSLPQRQNNDSYNEL